MPTVGKVTPHVPDRLNDSRNVLERITPVTKLSKDGIKMTVYGRTKTGKTRFACTFPKPLLLIGTEKGTDSVASRQGVDYVRIVTSEDIAVLSDLVERGRSRWKRVGPSKFQEQESSTGEPYVSVCLDTGGGLQDLILLEVKGLDDIPVQKSWGMASQQDWGIIGEQWKRRVRGLLDLAEIQKDVAIIAHERSFEDSNNSSDLVVPTVGAALTPKTAGWLNGESNYIVQTFIRFKTIKKMVKIGKEVVEQDEKTDNLEFCLRTGPHPVFLTGFRLTEDKDLPDVVVNPTYEKIKAIIQGRPIA